MAWNDARHSEQALLSASATELHTAQHDTIDFSWTVGPTNLVTASARLVEQTQIVET